MLFFSVLLTLLVFLISSYGLGFVTMRWAIRADNNTFPFLTVIGVADLIVMGGILNLAGMAYPAAMYVLILLGLACFVLALMDSYRFRSQLNRPHPSNFLTRKASLLNLIFPTLLVAIAVIFFTVTLLPSGVFNWVDDFDMYILRPVRMLQTGTLSGDLFGLIGLDSLGAQSFLQGFFLLILPVDYLPGFDAVFGFGLAGFLLISIAQRLNLSWVFTTLAILTFLVINPQSVNIAALFSGTFVILGLLFASCLLTESLDESGIEKPLGMAAIAGLLISSLVALKSTLVFFAVIYSALFFLGLFVVTPKKRLVLFLIATSGFCAAVTILPWLLLHLTNYVAAINVPSHTTAGANASIFSVLKGNVSEMFSTNNLYWGGSMLGYGTIIIELAVLGVASIFFMLPSSRSQSPQKGYSLVAASACVAAIGSYILEFSFFDLDNAVRYASPVLIATLPFAFLVAGFNATVSYSSQQRLHVKRRFEMVILTAASLVLGLFGSDFFDRIERDYNNRTTDSFPINDAIIRQNNYAFSIIARQTLRNIQYQTEAGSKILAWISIPFQLDFTRNEIQVVTAFGLLNPWLDIPLSGNPIDVARYFKKMGIRYIIWEYPEFGRMNKTQLKNMLLNHYSIYRRMAARNIYLINMLSSMTAGRNYIYKYNDILLFDLDQIN